MTQPDGQVNPWLTGVDFAISDRAAVYDRTTDYGAASLEAGGAAGGYSLDPLAANDMLTQTCKAIDDLKELKANCEMMKSVQPAAHDPASVAYNARLANGGGGAFDRGITQIEKEIQYLTELKNKIAEAFKKINGREATAADEMKRIGKQHDPSQPAPSMPPSSGGAFG